MGNNNSTEASDKYPHGEADASQFENIYARPRINRLSKPRVGAPTQTPITTALTRTLSSRALNSSGNNSPLPVRKRADSVDALYGNDSRSRWHGSNEPDGGQSVQLTRTNSFIANGAVQLSRANSFVVNGGENLNRRSWVSESNFQTRDFEANNIDINDPPMTASSTDSSYHSASQSPVPPDPLIPVRRKSLLMAAAPGTATRPPKPVAVDPPAAATAAELDSGAPDYFQGDSIIAKLAALNLAGERCETPNELELLGSLKKGTLFVTNGAPSPVPSSPELRSTSWGSSRRIPSLPNSMLVRSESSDAPPLPDRADLDDDNGHLDDNDATPRKAQFRKSEENEGQKTPSALARPDVRLDTTSPSSRGVRLVPPSPADEAGDTTYSVDNQKRAASEEGLCTSAVPELPQNSSAIGQADSTPKGLQDIGRAYSYAATDNSMYPSEYSGQTAVTKDERPGSSRLRSRFSFEQTDQMPTQSSGLKRSSSVIVVGTVAETVPDSARLAQDEENNPQYASISSRNTVAQFSASKHAAEKHYGESLARTGTDSGYSSTGSFFSRKSWRRSKHSRGNSVTDPPDFSNTTTIDAQDNVPDATNVDEFKPVAYSLTDGNPFVSPAGSPKTPRRQKQSAHSPLSERVRSKFSTKSTETTPDNTPTKNTPTKKRLFKGSLSFRRKSKKAEEIAPEAPSTDSFQVMKGTLPFDGRSFNRGSVYALDYKRKSPHDPHRTGAIPPPPEPVYSRRNSIDYGLDRTAEPEPQRSFAPRGAHSAPVSPLDNQPYTFEAVALTCDTPVAYHPKIFSTLSPGPATALNNKDDTISSPTSSSASLPSLNYDESELPPVPNLPPPPTASEALPLTPITQNASTLTQTPSKETPSRPLSKGESVIGSVSRTQTPKTSSRTPVTPRSPVSPQFPIAQPTPSRMATSFNNRQYRKVATPPPPTTTPPAYKSRSGYINNNNANGKNERSPLRKSPQPAAFYPPSSFRPPPSSMRGRNEYPNGFGDSGYEMSRSRSSEGNNGGNSNNSYVRGETSIKRRSLGASVLGGNSRRSGESDRERWGVDLSDIPVVKAEDLVNGYDSYRPGRAANRNEYEIDEREMFMMSNDTGLLDDDDDDDDDDEFRMRKKEKRGSWWRRSKSRSRTAIAI